MVTGIIVVNTMIMIYDSTKCSSLVMASTQYGKVSVHRGNSYIYDVANNTEYHFHNNAI